jgi:hypothetical protein
MNTPPARVRIQDVHVGALVRVISPPLCKASPFWGVILNIDVNHYLTVVKDDGRTTGASLRSLQVALPIPMLSITGQVPDSDQKIYRHWFRRFKGWPSDMLPDPAKDFILQKRHELGLRQYDGRGQNAVPRAWRNKVVSKEIHERRQRELQDEKYPEHAKLKKVSALSQSNGDFIDWLKDEKGLVLAEWVPSDFELAAVEACPDYVPEKDALVLATPRITGLLAEFHGIDENALEAEKTRMLEELRNERSKTD